MKMTSAGSRARVCRGYLAIEQKPRIETLPRSYSYKLPDASKSAEFIHYVNAFIFNSALLPYRLSPWLQRERILAHHLKPWK
jgi:hypothetical protein